MRIPESPGSPEIERLWENLLEGSERQMCREIARVQLAVQQRCDDLYDASYAEVSRRLAFEEARASALETVRAYRAAIRPALGEIKGIVRQERDCRDELFAILRDYHLWSSRLAAGR